MNASPLVTVGMLLIALIVALGFVLLYARAVQRLGGGAGRALVRASLFAAVWLGLFAALASSGLLAREELRPPPFMLVVLATFTMAIGLALSRVGETFARGLPLSWLVASQGFRLPLELVMHEAALEQTMPIEMSFTGYNFDIVTGSSALVVGLLLAKQRVPVWLVWVWNVVGSLLLTNIVCVAILATPMFRAFGDQPAQLNTWVFHFPFVWLPTVMVAAALFGHLAVFRALRRTHHDDEKVAGPTPALDQPTALD